MTQTEPSIPASLQQFAAARRVSAVMDEADEAYPHSEFYWRAAACLCLAGRVRPTGEGEPNRADVERVCKEANFNQYLLFGVVRFLTYTGVLTAERFSSDPYQRGPAFDAFWAKDLAGLRTRMWDRVPELLRKRSGLRPSLRPRAWETGLREFVTLFFSLFQSRAVSSTDACEAGREFCLLPVDDLRAYAVALGLEPGAVVPERWREWLEPKGTEALLGFLGLGRWLFATDDTGKAVYLGRAGAVMLGLAPPPPLPPVRQDLTVQSDLSVLAGVDLPAETLVALLKYTIIGRLDDVIRLRLDSKSWREAPAGTSPAAELAAALAPAGVLPQNVAALLGAAAPAAAGGTVRYLPCSAIVTSDDPQTLAAIRAHSKLKGYVEPDSPPGLLVIRGDRDPSNFLRRCRQLGYEIKPWSSPRQA